MESSPVYLQPVMVEEVRWDSYSVYRVRILLAVQLLSTVQSVHAGSTHRQCSHVHPKDHEVGCTLVYKRSVYSNQCITIVGPQLNLYKPCALCSQCIRNIISLSLTGSFRLNVLTENY